MRPFPFSMFAIIRRATVVALALACAVVPARADAQPQPGSVKPTLPDNPHSQSVRYFDGQRPVDVQLALDELRLEAAAGNAAVSTPTADAARFSVAPARAGERTRTVRLLAPARDRASLEARAAELAAANPGSAARAVLYPAGTTKRDPARGMIVGRQLTVKLHEGVDVDEICGRFALTRVEEVAHSPRTFILEVHPKAGLMGAVDAANSIHATGLSEFSTPLIEKRQQRRFTPDDPLFSRQWHLHNTGSNPGASGLVAGNDASTSGAWVHVQGDGINIAITDDGLQVAHPDLAPNVRTDIDWDYNYNDADPSPDNAFDDHGTACAGVAAARGGNTVGVTGAAPRARLVGLRLISDFASDTTEALAMLHMNNPAADADIVSVNSNSWGPDDAGDVVEGPGPITRAALENATTNGRRGKGTVFVWAAGNGGNNDYTTFDGYASSRRTIAVAATGGNGARSSYSERGSTILVNAPSSYSSTGITTTDRTGSAGYEDPAGDYTYGFGGTSSAAPLVAGCVALVLQANPALTWRDVQHLLVQTATKNLPADASWSTNAAGFAYSHTFGFGRVNAAAAVSAAPAWTPVPPEATPVTASVSASVAIPDVGAPVTSNLQINPPPGMVVEFVEATPNITHTYRGDLAMRLISPTGTTSQIAISRYDPTDNFVGWPFGSLAFWGENPTGQWTLEVTDTMAGDTGTLNGWNLVVYGYLSPSSVDAWSLY